jgi:hypothetical protein
MCLRTRLRKSDKNASFWLGVRRVGRTGAKKGYQEVRKIDGNSENY